ncbi:electron transfer flavoprotein subunit beta, partial [Streptomyces sp. NPDC020141]
VDAAVARPARSAGTVVEDGGEGGLRVAEFLAAQKFV